MKLSSIEIWQKGENALILISQGLFPPRGSIDNLALKIKNNFYRLYEKEFYAGMEL